MNAPLLQTFLADKTTGQVFNAPEPSEHQNRSTITWQTIEKIWNQGNSLEGIDNKTVKRT